MGNATPFPDLSAMSERQQRSAVADYFDSERVRLGLPLSDDFAVLQGELRTGILCAPASPRETCRFCGKRLRWDSDVNRVRCEKRCPGHTDSAPSVEEFQSMVAAGVPTMGEIADALREIVDTMQGGISITAPSEETRKRFRVLLARIDAAIDAAAVR